MRNVVVLILVAALVVLISCGRLPIGKAYSKASNEAVSMDTIRMLQNNCIVGETGDEGKVTSCNEICGNVVVPGSVAKSECVLGLVYRNDGSVDKVTFYPCGFIFSPSRNKDGSMDSYLDCYCCSP